MTPDQIKLARHALGLPNRRNRSYRNHYCVGAHCDEFSLWSEMVDAGHAKKFKPSPITGGDWLFRLTKDGAKLALRRNEGLGAEDFP